MKIAIAGGHSKKAQGAVGLLNEYECDRAYVAQLIPALRAAGHEVVDCSNEKGDQNSELAEEVRLANGSGADLFLAVHLNAGGGTGTEAWYYDGDSEGRALAARMSANVAGALGLRDRGAKATRDLYVLRSTKMTAVLLETCFVDNAADAAAWHATSWASLTQAVVNAIGGESAPAKPSAPQVTGSTERTGTGFGGTYRCQIDKLRVRIGPGLSYPQAVDANGNKVYYDKGGEVTLDDWYAIVDGWVWGRYTGSQSGQLRYAAVGKPTGGPAADDYLVKI